MSPNTRIHFYERARRSRRWKDAAYFSWLAVGRPVFTRKVQIRFTIRRGRKMDPDNLTCKSLLDGLKGHMIPDDSSEWVELLPAVQWTGKLWKGREEVVVEVWEISGEE